MNNQLKKLQNTVLMIAKEVKRICDVNGINYSMIGGTLIGSIRHKGFIPWDDDMDFAMTRDNYERFLEACKTQLGDEYDVLNWHTNDYFGYGFTKIILKGTSAIEKGKRDAKFPQCIFVDIFPIDNVPNSAFKRYIQRNVTYLLSKVLLQNDGSAIIDCSKRKYLIIRLVRIMSKHIKHNKVVKLCEKLMTKYDLDNTELVTCMVGFYGYSRDCVKKSAFENYIEISFEDTSFKAFGGYDIYLKKVFGNYLELPPVEDRKAHEFYFLDFGNY